ncbi:MAG TPA: MarR family transcriptional regulator [Acidimicrobiales bacterium]
MSQATTPHAATPGLGTSQLASRLRIAVARLSRRLRQQTPEAHGDITASQLAALGSIERLGPISLGELASIEQVQPPSMTRIVGRLEDLGFASRLVDPTDRRVARASATDAGRRFLARARTRKDTYLSRRIDRLEPAERDQLLRGIEILERLLGGDEA